MRVHRKKRWDITHSLTPQPDINIDLDYRIQMPEIPQVKKTVPYLQPSNASNHRSRKHRLAQQRNTEIQKTNRMLYEKIRKIMQKGHSSDKKIQPQHQEGQDSPRSNSHHNSNQFLTTAMKPLSLPQVRSNIFSLRSTQTELNNILQDRPKFAQKYFQQLKQARERMINVHTEQLANYVCFGWKVKVLKLNHGEFIVLSGRKGKKELKKKYIYEKVRGKVEGNLEEWASSKFQFQV